MIDVSIEKITDVRPHPNADKLELATILGWQVVIGKGSFKPGDEGLYIRSDAVISNKYQPDWATDLDIRKYLGGGGRVKTVELRGELSYGIFLPLDKFHIPKERLYALNEEGRIGAALGIAHYVPPIPADLNVLEERLPGRLSKSDEENYQNLSEKALHLGERALITQKMDGSSAALYYDPRTDELAFCNRTSTLKPDCDNIYTVALRPYVEQVKWLGKHFNEPVALRGEVCGKYINDGKMNRDAEGEPKFHMYAVHFPENSDRKVRFGRWKSGRHFISINNLLIENGLKPINAVSVIEILGTDTTAPVITMQLLKNFENAEAEAGEGIVINGDGYSYKVRSAKYDIANH